MTKLVKDIMNKTPKAIHPEEPIHKAASLMHKHDISHLPVIDENGELSGFVHARDIEEKVPNAKPHVDQILHAAKHNPKKAA